MVVVGKMQSRPRHLAFALAVTAASALAATGRIEGTLEPPERVKRVGVVQRIPPTIMKLLDKTHWGNFDPKTGHYSVENLSPGRYDLVVETPQGRIEGVWLHVLGEETEPTYDLNLGTGELKVKRFDINKYLEEGQVLPPKEAEKLIRKKLRIDKLVKRVKDLLTVARFMDTNRPLYVHGTPRRAVVLMELARGSRFYAEKGDEVIWRVESWPLIWMRDVWHKPNKGLRVWQRLRMPSAQFTKMGYVFEPALGGIEVKGGETTRVDYTVPEKLPESLGKAPRPW